MSDTGSLVDIRFTSIPRYLWHLDPGAWPSERINTRTGEHVPVVTGALGESLHPQVGGHLMAFSIPKAPG